MTEYKNKDDIPKNRDVTLDGYGRIIEDTGWYFAPGHIWHPRRPDPMIAFYENYSDGQILEDNR